MTAAVTIYALCCPKTNNIRYVGKANDIAKRLASHISDSRRRRTPVCDWIRSLAQQGLAPSIQPIEVCGQENWKEREIATIAECRAAGAQLLNLAIGGDEPFCPPGIRSENGRRVAALRISTPFRKRVYEIKRGMAQAIHLGYATEETKATIRLAIQKRPDLWASLAKWV